MAKQFEILLLDLDNTLYDYDKGEQSAFKKTMQVFDLPFDCYEKYKLINKGYWEKLERGEVTKDALRVNRFEDLLLAVKPDHDLDINLLADEYVSFLSKEAHPFDGAIEVLEALKGKYKIVALSNGIEKVQMSRLEISNMTDYFSVIIISEAVGANKPSPVIFNAALKAVDASGEYDKALMVGDNLKADIEGAMKLGITSLWMNYDHRQNDTGIVPDGEIRDIRALLTYLSHEG